MMGERRRGMAAAVFFLVFLALSVSTVDGALFSRKTRTDVPKEVSLNQAKLLLQRQKRAATTTDPPSGSPANQTHHVLLNEFVLNGSDHHYRAFVHWSGNKTSDVMFILTVMYNYSGVDSQLWKSTDYGSTFSKFNFEAGAAASYFYVSPADPSKMVFTDTQHKRIYTTTDELQHYTNSSLPVASDVLYMHPNKSDWMALVDYHTRQVYVTMDFGVQWTPLQKDVLNFYWGVPGIDDPHIVHLEIQHKDSQDSFYMRCTIPFCNATGDGLDLALGPVLPYALLVSEEFIMVQKVLQNGKEGHMMVSYQRHNFTNAYFPGSIKIQDIMILDTSEHQIFLAVNHGDHRGASLYLSDPKGQYYVLSLTNVHHRSFGHWFDVDMHKVKGMNGVYLANQLTNRRLSNLTSLVSFNKGGDWMKIRSSKQGCDHTQANCSILLRLDLENYFTNWILSEKRAPNFIIAHGHYGSKFENSWRNLTVFTSSDSGFTWKEAPLKGVYHFNILDQGSVVTAIKTGYGENTSQVHYSYDDGSSWHSETFKDGRLHVNGVLNEPSISTVVLGVYGHVSRSSPWTIVKLNFSDVLSRKCDDASDYIQWSPSDHDATVHENCLLGQEVSYKLKKATSRCFNGEAFNRTVNKKPCACTAEDFECDFGFFMENGECHRASWFDDGFIAPECTENQRYTKRQGYRKVATDKCVGGVENTTKYQSIQATCPLVAPGKLVITVNATVVATGQPVLFHLIQKRGSINTTVYSWNFGEHYSTENVTGLHNAQHLVKRFWSARHYYVKVHASNANGTSISNTLSIRAEHSIRRVGVFSVRAARVGDPVTVQASVLSYFSLDSSLHYQFRFGDEAVYEKDILTYRSNMTHVYNRTGTFTLTVTALNSVSAATKQASIQIIDDGIVVRLNFSSNVERMFVGSYHSSHQYWLERFQEELTMILGIQLDRLALSLFSSKPILIDCLIMPKSPKAPAYEMGSEQIAKAFADMVDNHTLSLFLDNSYMRWYGDINITAIQIIDYSKQRGGDGNKTSPCTGHGHNCTHHHGHNCTGHGHNCTQHHGHNCTGHGHNCTQHHGHNCTGSHGHNCTQHHGHNCTGQDKACGHDNDSGGSSGINYRAVYIAVPTVAVAAIVTVIVIVIYRKRSRATRYSLLDRDGSADPFFDGDDDLPLDMSDARDTGGDEPMLNIRN